MADRPYHGGGDWPGGIACSLNPRQPTGRAGIGDQMGKVAIAEKLTGSSLIRMPILNMGAVSRIDAPSGESDTMEKSPVIWVGCWFNNVREYANPSAHSRACDQLQPIKRPARVLLRLEELERDVEPGAHHGTNQQVLFC